MLSQGYLEEATRWIRTGLAAVNSAKIPDLLRVRALIALEGLFRFSHGFTEEGSALLEEAIQLCRIIGSQANPERVYALGNLSGYKKEHKELEALWKDALEFASDLDHESIWIHADLLQEIATQENILGNVNAACQYAEAALRLFSPEGCWDRWSSATVYDRLAYCAFSQGKNSESRVYRMKALALHQESGRQCRILQTHPVV